MATMTDTAGPVGVLVPAGEPGLVATAGWLVDPDWTPADEAPHQPVEARLVPPDGRHGTFQPSHRHGPGQPDSWTTGSQSTSVPLTFNSCRQFRACTPVAGVPGLEQVTVAVTAVPAGTSIGVTQW